MPSRFSQALGQRVRALRTERGRTQEGFATDVGVDRAFLGRIERGERGMSVLTAARVARALGMGLDDLFAGLAPYDPEDDVPSAAGGSKT